MSSPNQDEAGSSSPSSPPGPPEASAVQSTEAHAEAMFWGVGSVASRLDVAASTLRTWERRYDVGPTHRTAGGHRRYSEADIERVTLMQRLIGRGAPPMEAARVAHGLDADGLASALATDDFVDVGADLSHEDIADALLQAARAYDSARIRNLVAGVLRRDGVIEAWTGMIVPALVRIGDDWSRGEMGIEAEHLTSECLVAEIRAHTRSFATIDLGGASIVLASAEDDMHSLPLLALECALAEAGLACHLLGARIPAEALANMAATLRPTVIFIWASLPRTDDDRLWQVVESVGPPTTMVLGGPGWPHHDGHQTLKASASLQSTIEQIRALVG
ncbi:MerR family transcriptional regulator [Aeromicrobium sp.]|uniref:MerR family transcriptional regulator n=1 Tax=Aeromicrobium sp. TaxID=1871063 RepID=UPI0019CBB160|nr:MerR family transcriptional regulator [Aeromicrobium sp.]MBC7632942.1 MerR family transcriptional regulator [Aeromicrobium sp.]